MLKFRAFLVETRWSKYIYHATDSNYDPKEIKPGSHFGTLHSALGRTSAYPHNQNVKIHTYEYKPSGKSINVTDEGGEGEHYHRNMNVHSKKFDQYRKKHNITTAKYKNATEAPGKISHIIWDTNNLKHIHTFNAKKFQDRLHSGRINKFAHKLNNPSGP